MPAQHGGWSWPMSFMAMADWHHPYVQAAVDLSTSYRALLSPVLSRHAQWVGAGLVGGWGDGLAFKSSPEGNWSLPEVRLCLVRTKIKKEGQQVCLAPHHPNVPIVALFLGSPYTFIPVGSCWLCGPCIWDNAPALIPLKQWHSAIKTSTADPECCCSSGLQPPPTQPCHSPSHSTGYLQLYQLKNSKPWC